jgi:tetratricopeptide (TPR) repeat protein
LDKLENVPTYMKKLLFVIPFLLMNFSGYCQQSDSLLTVLKAEFLKQKEYDREKEKQISRLTDDAQIFEEYSSYKFDSAFAYIKQLSSHGAVRSQIRMANTLLNSGFFKEAFEVTETITDTLSSDFLFLRARLNAGIAEYDNDAHFAPGYRKQSEEDFKKAGIATPPNKFETTISQAFTNNKRSPEFYYNLIINHQLPPHNVAMVATRISYAFEGHDKVLFLALAAINDIRSSTKETLAIFLLGQELFKLGKTNDAYIVLQEAARNARFYGARNRALQIESILPLVAGKLIDEKQHEKDKLLIGLLTFLIVAIILFFLLVIYRRQLLRIKANELMIKDKNKELQSVNVKLWESSRIKEELIGLFIKTCSSYIATIDRIKQQTLHNIKLGKYKEVVVFLNTVHIDEEKDHLYEMLDSVFLTMFPNFVASFNALLKEEDQIWPKSGETLNATLRIFALIRLGINEHEAIAKILDYSVSTIYTYKTRIKSRALVPANDFEQKIMEIKLQVNTP